MARQLIKVGNSANDGKGDPLRTVGQKVNLSLLELYAFLSGDITGEVLPSALPVTRGGTGATSVTGAREALQLLKAAWTEIGMDEGNILVVGANGLGTDLAPVAPSATAGDPKLFKSGQFFYLVVDDVSAVTLGSRDSAFKAQVGVRDMKGAPSLVVRGSDSKGFTSWFKAFGENNSVVTVNGNIKYAENYARLTYQDCTAKGGKKLTMNKGSTGKYTITASTLNTSNWTLEVPMDYKGTVAFEAVAIQNGSAIEVTVTKGGSPYDIPMGSGIDIHLSK